MKKAHQGELVPSNTQPSLYPELGPYQQLVQAQPQLNTNAPLDEGGQSTEMDYDSDCDSGAGTEMEENEVTCEPDPDFITLEEAHKFRRLIKNKDLLEALCDCECTKRRRNRLLYYSDKGLRTAICECFKNVLNENVPISEKTLKRLEPRKQLIRMLGNSELDNEERKRIFKKQKGGFVGSILPLLLKPVIKALPHIFPTYYLKPGLKFDGL
jgi:hypothetical protein